MSQCSNLFFLQNKSEFTRVGKNHHIFAVCTVRTLFETMMRVCFKSNVTLNTSLYNNIIINKLYCVQDKYSSIINIFLRGILLLKIIITTTIIAAKKINIRDGSNVNGLNVE